MNYNEAGAKCEQNEDEVERDICFKEAKAVYEKHADKCKLQDCYESMEAELAGRFEWCNSMTDIVEKEICLKEAEALLKELKEENCHE
jgi:hypothetical protein